MKKNYKDALFITKGIHILKQAKNCLYFSLYSLENIPVWYFLFITLISAATDIY